MAALYLLAALLVEFWGDTDGAAEVERVDAPLLVHCHHDVIGRLIEDEQGVVAVKDEAAGRVEDIAAEGVGVGIPLVVIAEKL